MSGEGTRLSKSGKALTPAQVAMLENKAKVREHLKELKERGLIEKITPGMNMQALKAYREGKRKGELLNAIRSAQSLKASMKAAAPAPAANKTAKKEKKKAPAASAAAAASYEGSNSNLNRNSNRNTRKRNGKVAVPAASAAAAAGVGAPPVLSKSGKPLTEKQSALIMNKRAVRNELGKLGITLTPGMNMQGVPGYRNGLRGEDLLKEIMRKVEEKTKSSVPRNNKNKTKKVKENSANSAKPAKPARAGPGAANYSNFNSFYYF